MATRPVYIVNSSYNEFVTIKMIEFKWFPGMSKIQKQKSICSLHDSAEKETSISNILEVSSKSEIELGVSLSAFNLMIKTKEGEYSVETAFQSSKKFERGGPYLDLLKGTSGQAKKDNRLKQSGNLVEFVFFGRRFNLEPKTFFYDWLYVNALNQNKELSDRVLSYTAFTDIEFNPNKSINCQAYSVALYQSLRAKGLLMQALESPENFLNLLNHQYHNKTKNIKIQSSLPGFS